VIFLPNLLFFRNDFSPESSTENLQDALRRNEQYRQQWEQAIAQHSKIVEQHEQQIQEKTNENDDIQKLQPEQPQQQNKSTPKKQSSIDSFKSFVPKVRNPPVVKSFSSRQNEIQESRDPLEVAIQERTKFLSKGKKVQTVKSHRKLIEELNRNLASVELLANAVLFS